MAGLPGTGLGGIFYILLVAWMAVRESWRLAQGASDSARWARIGGLAGLSGAIVLALWVEGWAIRQVLSGILPGSRHAAATEAAFGGAVALEALTPALAVMPFLTLAALLLAVHALRLLRRA